MAQTAAAPTPRTEPREAWKPQAVRLWVSPAERWRRLVWAVSCLSLPLGVGPAILLGLSAIAAPGNIGYILLLGATSYMGLLGTTLGLAVRFEPQDVRIEITRSHIALDAVEVPTELIARVSWDDDVLVLHTEAGAEHRSRPIAPNDPDRLMRLIEGALDKPAPPTGDRPRGLLVPLLRPSNPATD